MGWRSTAKKQKSCHMQKRQRAHGEQGEKQRKSEINRILGDKIEKIWDGLRCNKTCEAFWARPLVHLSQYCLLWLLAACPQDLRFFSAQFLPESVLDGNAKLALACKELNLGLPMELLLPLTIQPEQIISSLLRSLISCEYQLRQSIMSSKYDQESQSWIPNY